MSIIFPLKTIFGTVLNKFARTVRTASDVAVTLTEGSSTDSKVKAIKREARKNAYAKIIEDVCKDEPEKATKKTPAKQKKQEPAKKTQPAKKQPTSKKPVAKEPAKPAKKQTTTKKTSSNKKPLAAKKKSSTKS